MRKTIIRLLSVLLCASLLCGMLPTAFAEELEPATAVTAEEAEKETPTAPTEEESTEPPAETVAETIPAEETVAETAAEETAASEETAAEEVHTEIVSEEAPTLETEEEDLTIATDEYGNITFASFADLQYLASQTYTDYTMLNYVGEGPLVIAEDLTLSEYMNVSAAQVTVAEGVTLSVSGALLVSDALTVNGSLYDAGYIRLEGDAALTGGDKIRYAQSWYSLYRDYSVTDTEGFLNVLAKASDSAETNMVYQMTIRGTDITLTKDVTIPGNCNVSLQTGATLTIAQGATLNWSAMGGWIGGTLTIRGTLCNNSAITVGYDDGGKLVLADGGQYSGTGYLRVHGSQITVEDDLSNALVNLDINQFQVSKNQYNQDMWELRPIEGLTRLGTPTDLQWGYDATGNAIPGYIRWKTAEPDQNHAMLCFYRVLDDETSELVYSTSWYFGEESSPAGEWRSTNDFTVQDMESGTYYFTVTATGDYTQYYDSETAVSDTWTYVKPEAKVASCSGLTWNWPIAVADAPADMTDVGGFYFEFFYSASENAQPTCVGATWWHSTGLETTVSTEIQDEYVQDNGSGYYYFKVRALSADITRSCNGDWSELSPAYNLNQTVENVKDQLNKIEVTESSTDEEKAAAIAAVQELDTDSLKSAMLADQGNDGVVKKLADLETAAAGGQASVSVSEVQEIDAAKVSVVGANLNTSSGGDITLVIDAPKNEEDVIPELYDDTVAVSFSMDLENVKDSEKLKVPVQITLPVPENVNPQFLVILHYHAESGEPEEIRPYVYQDSDGQWYASFVLTSFSDFVITMDAVRGDFTGDRNVTIEDAAELLWRSLMETVSLKRADFNNDKTVDNDDVVYLLWHILFGQNYFPI